MRVTMCRSRTLAHHENLPENFPELFPFLCWSFEYLWGVPCILMRFFLTVQHTVTSLYIIDALNAGCYVSAKPRSSEMIVPAHVGVVTYLAFDGKREGMYVIASVSAWIPGPQPALVKGQQ